MSFKDADELYDYVGGIFDDAMADDEVGPKFADSGVVLKLVYTEPAAQLVVDMPNRVVYRGTAGDELKPTVQLFMKSAVGHQFWLGNVNISTALAKGQMRAKGPIPKILKLVPLARSLFPNYRKRLEDEGRTDLLDG